MRVGLIMNINEFVLRSICLILSYRDSEYIQNYCPALVLNDPLTFQPRWEKAAAKRINIIMLHF